MGTSICAITVGFMVFLTTGGLNHTQFLSCAISETSISAKAGVQALQLGMSPWSSQLSSSTQWDCPTHWGVHGVWVLASGDALIK